MSDSTRLEMTLDDDRMRPFLPLVYSAWSDGELTPDEISSICDAVDRHPKIDADCRTALRLWLDPQQPPTPVELELLRRRVADWSAALESQPGTVVALGLALTRATRSPVSAAEEAAVADIEASVGPLGAVPARLRGPVVLRTLDERPATFDVADLTSVLDGRYGPIRSRMRELLSRPEFRYVEDLSSDEYREQVLVWTRRLAAEGIGRLGYPAPFGTDQPGEFAAAFAQIGHHDLSLLTKVGVQFGLFGGAIARLGTTAHHEQYLTDIASLELAGCFAMTETGHGSNVRDLETTATYDRDADVLVVETPHHLARKDYIGNAAAHGRMAVVFARLLVDDIDHGVHAVLVPIRTSDGSTAPGIRIEDNAAKGGLAGVDNGRLWFDDVRVPRAALLNRFASIDEDGTYHSEIPDPDRRFFTTIGTLVGGRIGVGAAAVNVAKSALTIAVRYAHRRRQFGPEPGAEELLIDYPLHQQRLIPRLAATYAYHFAYESLFADFADGTSDQRQLEARAAGLKAFASWHALDTLQEAREACGGQGYLAENRLVRMRADADVFTTYEGDNTVLVQLVAKGLLSNFKQQFESMSPTGVVRYVLRRAATVIGEASPITRSATDPEELVDPVWQLGELQWQRDHQVETLAQRIKKRLDEGVDPFDAFTQVQAHAMSATRSHIDWLVHTEFVAAIERLEPGPVREVLDRLRSLHGLALMQANLAYFQEHGHFSAAGARAVRKQHDRLVAELATESLALVDAFAIPDAVLSAPIAVRD